MKANSFGYLLKQGLHNLWANRMMTLASVGVLSACLIIVGCAVLLVGNINSMVSYVEDQNEMMVFIYDEDEVPTGESTTTIIVIPEDTGVSASAWGYVDGINYGEEDDTFVSQYGVFTDADHDGYDDYTDYYFNFVDEDQDGYDDNSGLYFGFPDGYDPSQYEVTVNGITSEEAEANRENYVAQLQAEIEAMDNIASVTYQSKEEGMLSLREQVGEEYYDLFDDDYIYGEDNNLPDSFIVTVIDLSLLEETIEEISQLDEVYSIQASTQVASTMTTLRQVINVVSWAIVAALVVVSLVIITNTIRASIYSRRKEINIMKYVGATNAFIRLPFIVEGICLGIIAAAISFGLVSAGYCYLLNAGSASISDGWVQQLFGQMIPFENIAWGLAFLFLAASVLLGVLGSLISVRKHIKV